MTLSMHVGYVIPPTQLIWHTRHTDNIYTKYSTLPSGISVYIVPKDGIFPEAGGRGKYSLPRVQYMPILHKEGYIGYSLRGTTVSVATYPFTMRSIRGGTLGWNIEIYSTPTNQFDWSVSRAYVINIYIYITRNLDWTPQCGARFARPIISLQQRW